MRPGFDGLLCGSHHPARSRGGRHMSYRTPGRLLLTMLATLSVPLSAHAEKFRCGRTGGDFIYGLEANVAGLDMQANGAATVRDIAMNTYETLVTRDENMKPLLQLAQSVEIS